ncbi:hypothetical protein GCM10028803_44520 [Larkinella knui]|uniref:DUF4276 family protein n=1 Tax=Larkinella knui TaxID=2025310 RepID=A0A3P1CP20_9BACT|nr:DUF4276 family protein [Larkinella knui]RRB15061.1 DUF4276 family protein [Larkinella knui]
MTKLIYTLVGEGFAEYAFIPAYLKRMAENRPVQFVRSNIRIAISANPSSSKVIEKAPQLCEQALVSESHEPFIIGIDLDKADFPPELIHHTKRMNELVSKLGKLYKTFEKKIVLYIPIQAFDHWLYYQFYKVNSKEIKPAANSLEAKHQEEVKSRLYGKKVADRLTMEKIAKTVAEKADFDELAKQSRSFNHFHQQIVTFLASYNNTTTP